MSYNNFLNHQYIDRSYGFVPNDLNYTRQLQRQEQPQSARQFQYQYQQPQQPLPSNIQKDTFTDILSSKLNYISEGSPHSSVSSIGRESILSNNTSTSSANTTQQNISNSFNLPLELQGGVSNISSRRPSYTAEFYYNTNQNYPSDLQNQYQINQLSQPLSSSCSRFFDSSPNLDNNNRTHSIDYSLFNSSNNINRSNEPSTTSTNPSTFNNSYIPLDNGLLLDRSTNTIITSAELKNEFNQSSNYFGSFEASLKVVDELNLLLGYSSSSSPSSSSPSPRSSINSDLTTVFLQNKVNKLLDYLLTQNDDLNNSNHLVLKSYSLILNKNGKLDIISFPKNSNLKLMPKDLIIIEGDRGKDLVMVLKPVIDFKFALLFNYLKKKLHLKSLEFGNSSSNRNQQQQQPANNNNSNNQPKSIINEDENFITLPNKQILRFAKPNELNQLKMKYNDELIALNICLNYVMSLNLNLIIKNVEFQFDKKKLIIYYYCLNRLDFRQLIKELFKIYKTRIWLCAILPIENSFEPLVTHEEETKKKKMLNSNNNDKNSNKSSLLTPPSSSSSSSSGSSINANLTITDQLPNTPTSINSTDQLIALKDINNPIYFHSKIFLSLINWFKYQLINSSNNSNNNIINENTNNAKNRQNNKNNNDKYWFLN